MDTAIEKKSVLPTRDKGGVVVKFPSGDPQAQQTISTPFQVDQETAGKIAVSLTQADLLPPGAEVRTQPAEEQAIPVTPDIEHVGGKALGHEELQIAGNAIKDIILYPMLGASRDISKFTVADADQGTSIWNDKQKKEETALPDDEEIAA